MATIDLNELRKEIDLDRKRLADKEAVLRYLEEMEGGVGSLQQPTLSEPLPDGIIELDKLVPDIDRRTLIDDVQDVVSRFGHQEFSVVHVDAALKHQGVEIKGGKFPRSRISTVLGKLEDQGVIVRTFKGGGNVPNRYTLKDGALELVS